MLQAQPAAAATILHILLVLQTQADASIVPQHHSQQQMQAAHKCKFHSGCHLILLLLLLVLLPQGNPFDEEEAAPASDDYELDPELTPPAASARAKQKLKTVIQTIKASTATTGVHLQQGGGCAAGSSLEEHGPCTQLSCCCSAPKNCSRGGCPSCRDLNDNSQAAGCPNT